MREAKPAPRAAGPTAARDLLPWEPGVRADRIVFVKHPAGSLVWTVTLAPTADSAQVAAFRTRAAQATGATVNLPLGWPLPGVRRETLLELEVAPARLARDSARVARWLAGDALVLRVDTYRGGAAR